MDEPKRLGKWTPKLTDEARTFALVQMACDVPSTVVARQLVEKFNIQITSLRLRVIRDSKNGFPIYDAARTKYLAEKTKMPQIAIACQINRVREAGAIAKKLGKLINKVETKIDELTEDGIEDSAIKNITALGRMLKDTAHAYKEFLSYVREETVETRKTPQALAGSFLTQININSKQPSDSKTIEAETIEPNASSDE